MSDYIKDSAEFGVGRGDFGINRPPVLPKPASEPSAKPADDPATIDQVGKFTNPDPDVLRKARLGGEDFRQRTEGIAHPSQIQSDQASARLGDLQKPTGSSRTH